MRDGVLCAPRQPVQARRIRYRERPQYVGVEHGEGDGQQAETDRQRADGGGEKGGVRAQPAPRVSDVLPELLEPHPAAAFVELLARPRRTAEGAQRRRTRLLARHAVRDETIDLEGEMRLELSGKVVVGSSGRH